jgi:hypothetical protein
MRMTTVQCLLKDLGNRAHVFGGASQQRTSSTIRISFSLPIFSMLWWVQRPSQAETPGLEMQKSMPWHKCHAREATCQQQASRISGTKNTYSS